MMISTTTRQKIKADYQNSNRKGIAFDKGRAYAINLDRDGIMPMIKMLYAVYQQVKNC